MYQSGLVNHHICFGRSLDLGQDGLIQIPHGLAAAAIVVQILNVGVLCSSGIDVDWLAVTGLVQIVLHRCSPWLQAVIEHALALMKELSDSDPIVVKVRLVGQNDIGHEITVAVRIVRRLLMRRKRSCLIVGRMVAVVVIVESAFFQACLVIDKMIDPSDKVSQVAVGILSGPRKISSVGHSNSPVIKATLRPKRPNVVSGRSK